MEFKNDTDDDDYIFSAKELAEIDEMLALDEDDYELTPEELAEADELFALEAEFTEEALILF